MMRVRQNLSIFLLILAGSAPLWGKADSPANSGTGKSSGVIYVNAKAKAKGDGTSWQKPFTDLGDALAIRGPREIWVAGGIYKPGRGSDSTGATFLLDTGVTLYGGFAGKEKHRQDAKPSANITILSGDIGKSSDLSDNAWTVVTTTERNRIDGFHITDGHGNSNYAAGVVGLGDLEISRCVFISNLSKYGTGGLALFGGSPTVRECIFTKNSGQTAGAINAASSNPAILNCIFFDNESTTWAGAVLFQAVGYGTIGNSTFHGNSAPIGSGLTVVAGEPGFLSKVEVGNSIFWKNQYKGSKEARESEVNISQVNRNNNVEFMMVSCIVKGGTDPKSTGVQVQDTVLTSTEFHSVRDIDPMLKIEKKGVGLAGPDGVYFTSDDGLNVEIRSPAINTGTNLPLVSSDILGRPRMIGGFTDIGAFEN